MKRLFIVATCFTVLSCIAKPFDFNNVIIPKPNLIKVQDGSYTLDGISLFFEDKEVSKDLTEIVEIKLGTPTGMTVTESSEKDASIRFIKESWRTQDSYSLKINEDGISIASGTYGGYFYGIQTLLQVLPKEIKSRTAVGGVKWELPCLYIEDLPRFNWRGMMLDVSRHWFTKEEVMAYIDEIAEYKFNIFHWHLTDDQGWRIQIDSYPKLTSIGSKRAERVGQWWKREPQQEGEEATYGGFYTKDDVREVLEYARKRNVTIMPEIDIPGHSLATLVAYPELACLNAPKTVNVGNKYYGIDENSLCAGNEATFKLLSAVFREVAELFPFEYIHIGGDECFKGFWKKCPKCQKRMADEHLKNTKELQSYFIKRVSKILSGYGKKIVGWDEILEGGLAEGATVMSWRGTAGGITAAKAGHKVIMTPTTNCYLDLYQGEKSVEPNTYSMLRLSSCYAFEPIPDGIDENLILGGQGNLWCESVPTFRHAEYMAWPRGWALSEVFWSKKNSKNWMDFVRRTEEHFQRAEIADINHADRSMYNVIMNSYMDNENVRIELSSEIEDVTLHYTFDNTNPDLHTPKYTRTLSIPKDATWLRVQSYRNGKKVGDLVTFNIEDICEAAKKGKPTQKVGNL